MLSATEPLVFGVDLNAYDESEIEAAWLGMLALNRACDQLIAGEIDLIQFFDHVEEVRPGQAADHIDRLHGNLERANRLDLACEVDPSELVALGLI